MTVLTYRQLVAQRAEYYASKGYRPMATQHAPSSGPDAFEYQAPTDEQTQRIIAVRQSMKDLRDQLQNLIPPSRELSLSITKLEECSMWANKAIVFSGPRPEPHP